MNTLIHADMFFFISSIGFIIFAILLTIILIKSIQIINRVDRISKKIEDGMSTVTDEVKDLIEDLKDSPIFRFVFGISKRKKAKQAK